MEYFEFIASVILAAVIGGVAYLAVRYVSLGVTRKISNLEGSIQRIYELSDPRLSLMVRQVWGNKFLQFRSLIYDDIGRSLELWLPKMGWSEDFYPWIVRKCIENDFSFREFVDNLGNEYVVISFGADYVIASEFSKDILVNMFRMRENGKVKVRIDLHKYKSKRNLRDGGN